MKTKQELDELLQNVVVHCKTEEEANKVLELANKVGYHWWNTSLKLINFYNHYSVTCYNITQGTFYNRNFYEQRNYKIITAQEFINLVNEEDMKKEFTKNDLKSGMVVETRGCGKQYLVLNNLLISCNSSLDLDDYSENLIHKNCKFSDIISIYEFDCNGWYAGLENGICYGKLIWERKEIKHFTKEDIAKMINMNVDNFVID